MVNMERNNFFCAAKCFIRFNYGCKKKKKSFFSQFFQHKKIINKYPRCFLMIWLNKMAGKDFSFLIFVYFFFTKLNKHWLRIDKKIWYQFHDGLKIKKNISNGERKVHDWWTEIFKLNKYCIVFVVVVWLTFLCKVIINDTKKKNKSY